MVSLCLQGKENPLIFMVSEALSNLSSLSLLGLIAYQSPPCFLPVAEFLWTLFPFPEIIFPHFLTWEIPVSFQASR